MNSIYERGDQPCQKYDPQEADVMARGIANVHQCPICWGRRSFCLTCHRDHHEHGWETCKPEAYREASDE